MTPVRFRPIVPFRDVPKGRHVGSEAAREELIRWRRIRRYAVPRWMIEQATERRLAGDWRGACAAAGVDVLFDLVTVERVHGPATAAALAEDLRHLVPDLLRWHLPRGTGVSGTLDVRRRVTLVRHGAGVLHVALPERIEAPQRLTLRFGPTSPTSDDWTAARHLWDARNTPELLERHGAGHPHAERVTALHEQGRVEEAFEAAGLDLELVADDRYLKGTHHLDALARLPLNVARLGAEAALLAERGLGRRFHIAGSPTSSLILIEPGPARATVRYISRRDHQIDYTRLAPVHWHRLPDLDLLRAGRLTPDELHPLVRQALFPALSPATAGPRGPEPLLPVRVRCGTEWHEIAFGDGALRIPHSHDEQRRERALRSLGGVSPGCFLAQEAWTTGRGRLPRDLRLQRRRLFLHVQHGDTPAVRQLLDAGIDPHVRDGNRRGLLHLLSMVDHELLLPRLLAAGLDVHARDVDGRTPLHHAVAIGPSALVRALRAAGARADVVDALGRSPADLVHVHRRTDLADL